MSDEFDYADGWYESMAYPLAEGIYNPYVVKNARLYEAQSEGHIEVNDDELHMILPLRPVVSPRTPTRDELAKAIWEADPGEGMTWAQLLEATTGRTGSEDAVEWAYEQADAVLALLQDTEQKASD